MTETEPIVAEYDPSLLEHPNFALFDQARTYRYLLVRRWDTRPVMTWVMLNPSTADAFTDDPTIRRCTRFARREDCGGIAVVNLFALRATDPRALRDHPDPVGPLNDQLISEPRNGPVVAAWGAHGTLRDRSRKVSERLATAGIPLLCLGVTGAGHPRHPLYVRADAPLVPFGGTP